MTTPKKISITVVVNGQPADVEANISDPVGSIIPDALRQTGLTPSTPVNLGLQVTS